VSRRGRGTTGGNDIVSLATPTLDLVLRLKAGLIAASNDLRPSVVALLKEMEERAETLRYSQKVVNQVKFALAAFVDETVLTNDFPLKTEWEKYPLQLEYFGEQLAGITYFERLKDMCQNHLDTMVDAIEVYYLCLLLGFKGKYKIYLEHELKGVIETTAEYLRKAGRLQAVELSPHWLVQDQPEPPKKKRLPIWFKISTLSLVALMMLVYLILIIINKNYLDKSIEKLLR
jgi:type VI secretion system protein ImpK